MMDDKAVRVVEATTESLLGAISWDSEITVELGRYATWLTAFCTAGIGLWIARSSAWIDTAPFGICTLLALVMSGLLLFSGLIVGALLRRSVKKCFSLKRQQMTVILHQKAVLFAADIQIEALDKLVQQILRCEFVGDEMQRKYQDLEEQDHRELPENSKRVVYLEVATALGFLLLLTSVILGGLP